MLVVKIELWPHGDEQKKREIGRTYIWNTGEGNVDKGEYAVAVCRRGSKERNNLTRTGLVKNYPRTKYNVWRLVIRALRSAFPEER